MNKIATHHDLENAIRELEAKSKLQEVELRERFELVIESVSPRNIIKTAFQQISTSSELKNTAINTAIGLGTGILTRKLYIGKSANFLKRITGTVLQFAVASFVKKKAPVIRERIAELTEKKEHSTF